MRSLSLADLKLALDDLFDNPKRKKALVASSCGKTTYAPKLQKARAQIDALPPALTGAPLRDEAAETDARHDGFGRGLYYHLQGYLEAPTTTDDIRAAASRIVDALVPELAVLVAPLSAEASAAHANRDKLPSLKGDLKHFPLAGGGTLLDWAEGYVSAGESLDALLQKRADITSKTRTDAGKIRGATIGALTKFRAALADEVSENDALPRTLVADVFAYFDDLDTKAASRAARKGAAKTATPGDGASPAAASTPAKS